MSPSVHWLVPDALDRAGLGYAKSIRLCCSFPFGRRQSPAFEPSVRPAEPLARVFASDKACSHVLRPKALAFFNQINLVSLSLTVPLPLSTKRGFGHATPFFKSPSSPPVAE